MTDLSHKTETMKPEELDMFQRCLREGRVPIPGVQITPDEGRGIGQFLFSASITSLCEITRDPFTYLGGATKSEKARWTDEDRDYANVYSLIQREFSAKKRKNVDRILEYVARIVSKRDIGFLPAPILWFQDEDIYVTEHFIGVKRSAFPHIIDGSTRIAALHRLKKVATEEQFADLETIRIPVIAIYGPDVDEDTAAQIFCDVNFLAIPVDPSTAKSMDRRDIHVRLTKEVEQNITILKDRVAQRRQLTATDLRLFTKYALFQSLRCFTDGIESLDKSFKSKALSDETFSDVLEKTLDLWRRFEEIFGPHWNEAGARDKYLHVHAPVLKAMSAYLRRAYFPTLDTADRDRRLSFLAALDWSRDNDAWVGTLTKKGPRGMKIVNNDPVVRELAKLLEDGDARMPRKAREAAA